jgi:CubicO group peptidase (beta-lactamase class C family)
VIEAVTGTSYYAYIRDHIYRPAGMWNAGAQPQDRIISHLAIGYDKEYTGKGIRFRNNRFVIGLRGGPAGDGYATAHDLLAFATALQNGKLLDKGFVDTFTAAKPDVGADRYGYGFSVDPEQNIAGHSGGFAGVHANMDMFLEESYVAVVLSNYRGALGPVRSKIRNLIQRTAPPN